MKALDKIYIDLKGEELSKEWFEEPCPQNDATADITTIEYIRKDALMEWLGEQLTASYNSMDIRSNLAYSKVVDKIKSL